MVDFSTYKPPGVYIDEAVSAIVGPVGTTPSLLALVGPGVGYRVHTQVVTLTATTAVTLEKTGVVTASIVVKSISGTLYALTTDYVVGGSTTLARAASGSTIGSGETVVVTYQYTDADYTTVAHFTNFDDFTLAYGQPFDADGAIQSPLSLAARFAFLNGAREIVAVALDTATPAQTDFSTAYTQLLSEEGVAVVVPIGVGIDGDSENTELGTDLALHCEEAKEDNLFRTAILGSAAGTDDNIQPNALAQSIAHERVDIVWPNRISYYNGLTNATVEVDGYYLAAAVGGRLVGLEPQEPLTRKGVVGFQSFPSDVLTSMTRTFKNTLSQSGVSVVERTRDGRLVVRHGVTTDRSTLMKREISLVRQRDAMVDLIYRTLLAYNIIGSAITDETPTRVGGIAEASLETLVNADTIAGYQNVNVRQTSVDPTVIEVKWEWRPAYPANYVVLAFTVNVDSGELALNSAATGVAA